MRGDCFILTESVMNKLLAAAALAAVVATPAFAQYGGQSVDQLPQPNKYGQPGHMAASGHHVIHGHSSNSSNDVYDTEGFYVGSDPDPLIRDELRRDHNGRGY
jgi:hypothetical protein